MANLPLLLGHRGARASASVAENTFASFDLALRQGCDGFEFDVRLAGDGSAVTPRSARSRLHAPSPASYRNSRDLKSWCAITAIVPSWTSN
jgi:hypothetical protein